MALNVFNRKQLVHFTVKNKIKIQLIAIDKKGKPAIWETSSHYIAFFLALSQDVTKVAERRSVQQQSRVTQDKVTIRSASILIVDSQSESDEQKDGFRACFRVDLLIVQAFATFPTHFS